MLIGVVSDVHGDTRALAYALDALREREVATLVATGDLLECHTPKEGIRTPIAFTSATTWDQRLPSILGDAIVVRGNQEERLRAASRPESVPSNALRLLTAPLRYDHERFTFLHGHTLEWSEVREDHWRPVVEADVMGSGQVLVHGHHHRNAVTVVMADRHSETEDVTPADGEALRFERGISYMVNVGPAQGPHPSFAVIDDEQNSVVLHYRDRRFRR
jgi:predicted phosphodiesterase